MRRRLRTALASLLGRSEDDEDDEDDGRFRPSPLDSSVRYAHGGSDTTVERELDRIDERARELEENRD